MRQSLGQFGEAWAVGLLTRHGYRIVERNVRVGRGELDIVAWHGETLVFVEVKSRRTSLYGSPEAAITRNKYERLAAAIAGYLQSRELQHAAHRIDVVAIEVGDNGTVVRGELIENVEAPSM